MAGLGRRTFAAGEVLTAGNVMGYLQDQAVMNFAGTAARGSAIGTAVSEGMVSYLADLNQVQVYDGSAWKQVYPSVANAGEIIQVVTWRETSPFTSTATSFTSLLSVSITPRSTSSRIIVVVSLVGTFIGADSGRRNLLSIFRNGTNISNPNSPGSRSAVFGGFINRFGSSDVQSCHITAIDSPASTSSLTYAISTRMEGGDTLYINRGNSDTDSALYARGVSSITVMEIAG